MNRDRHGGHARPRVFVSKADPIFVAVCAPHEEAGPWSEPVPFGAQTEVSAWSQGSKEPRDVRRHSIGEINFRRRNWETDARSELAVAALRLFEPRFRNLRFEIEVLADAAQRRPALAAYADTDEFWFVDDDERRAIVATCELEVVRYLSGVEVTLATSPFVTVAVRAKGFAAALYFDWDDDRFYIAEPNDVLLQVSIDAAQSAGFEVICANEDSWVMSGVHEYLAGLKNWSRYRSDTSPFTASS